MNPNHNATTAEPQGEPAEPQSEPSSPVKPEDISAIFNHALFNANNNTSHSPNMHNWDLVAEEVNKGSVVYRLPRNCRERLINTIIPRASSQRSKRRQSEVSGSMLSALSW